MTNEEMRALAERAVKCKAWRWMPGMQDEDGDRVIKTCKGHVLVSGGDEEPRWYPDGREYPALPDLADPATLGCLLALVREAWGDDGVVAVPYDDADDGIRWSLTVTNGPEFHTPSELWALVVALEAAP